MSIDKGIERIERFLADYGRQEQADQVNELSFLKRWRREVAESGKRTLPRPEDYEPDDPVEQLRTRLADAIAGERYEEAANLRDELGRLENPPPPTG